MSLILNNWALACIVYISPIHSSTAALYCRVHIVPRLLQSVRHLEEEEEEEEEEVSAAIFTRWRPHIFGTPLGQEGLYQSRFELTSAEGWPCSGVRPSSSSVVVHRSSPMKPLDQSKPNFMWSILRKGERKFI